MGSVCGELYTLESQPCSSSCTYTRKTTLLSLSRMHFLFLPWFCSGCQHDRQKTFLSRLRYSYMWPSLGI